MGKARASFVAWLEGLDPETRAILLLLVVAFVRGVIYATIVPAWQSADEPTYVLQLQTFIHRLLPSAPSLLPGQNVTSEPTVLFYAVYSPFYLVTSPLGAYLQLLALRLVSVGLGVATIYVVYRTAKLFAPDDLVVCLGAPLFVALLPQFTHVSGSLSADTLATLCGSAFFYFAVRLLRQGTALVPVLGLVLSVVFAALSKQTAFFVAPVALLVPLLMVFRTEPEGSAEKRHRAWVIGIWAGGALAAGGLVAGAARVLTEANLSRDLVVRALGVTQQTNPLVGSAALFDTLFSSFWAYLGWLSVRLPDSYYAALGGLSLLAVAGVGVVLFRVALERGAVDRSQILSIILFLAAFVLSLVVVRTRQALSPSAGMAQGRWLFPGLAAISTLMVLGWRQAFARRLDKALLLTMAITLFLFDAVVLRHAVGRYYVSFPQTFANVLTPATNTMGRVLQPTLEMRPVILATWAFYALLGAGYVAAFAEWCLNLGSALPETTEEDAQAEDRPALC